MENGIITFNSPNMPTPGKGKVRQQLKSDQQPLGTQFKSYELTEASNYWTLDPFQYSITKFHYNLPIGESNIRKGGVGGYTGKFDNDPGLIYKGIDFEKLLPSFTSEKKSVNDFRAMDYHRFLANEGYFNPTESINNSDLWYYGASDTFKNIGIAGAQLNKQEVNHIIFSEPQRGGTNTKTLARYSWSPTVDKLTPGEPALSWGEQNILPVDNNKNCEFFNWNSKITPPSFNKAYSFDSNYVRRIGTSGPDSGSMPFTKNNSLSYNKY